MQENPGLPITTFAPSGSSLAILFFPPTTVPDFDFLRLFGISSFDAVASPKSTDKMIKVTFNQIQLSSI